MESYLPHLSLAGSALSTLVTVYFWIVKAQRERVRLRAFVTSHEFFLGNSNANERQLGFKLGLVIANYSTLPNAVIKVLVSWLGKDGVLIPVAQLAMDKDTPLPVNLSALQTAALRLQGNLTFPYSNDLETGKAAASEYLGKHLLEPRRVRVELVHLGDRIERFDLPMDGR